MRPRLSWGSRASAPQNCPGHVHGGQRIIRRFDLHITKPSGPGILDFMVQSAGQCPGKAGELEAWTSGLHLLRGCPRVTALLAVDEVGHGVVLAE